MPAASKERAEAVAKGLKFYTAGAPCVRGHIGPRYIGGSCVECSNQKGALKRAATTKEVQNAYAREYRALNKEKLNAYEQRYREQNRERILIRERRRRSENPQPSRDAVRRHREKDLEKHRAKDRSTSQVRRDSAVPSYLAKILRKKLGVAIAIDEIPESIIEVQRLTILLKRKLKELI